MGSSIFSHIFNWETIVVTFNIVPKTVSQFDITNISHTYHHESHCTKVITTKHISQGGPPLVSAVFYDDYLHCHCPTTISISSTFMLQFCLTSHHLIVCCTSRCLLSQQVCQNILNVATKCTKIGLENNLYKENRCCPQCSIVGRS
jgi:hypothetical protein